MKVLDKVIVDNSMLIIISEAVFEGIEIDSDRKNKDN